jgi:nucleotide-binding universal stress UspA family protein
MVVGYDGSPESRAALEMAAHAAGPLGKVFVVIAFEEPPGWMGDQRRDVALDRAESYGRTLIKELTEHAVPGLRSTPWEAELLPEPAADAILRVAEVRDADEIFIGTRGRGRTRSVIGSVSHDVLHGADRPVHVMTHAAAERLARVPAATP